MTKLLFSGFLVVMSVVAISGCSGGSLGSGASPTPADAKAFLARANEALGKLGIEQNQAGWIAETYITDDTEAINAKVTQEVTDAIVAGRRPGNLDVTREMGTDDGCDGAGSTVISHDELF